MDDLIYPEDSYFLLGLCYEVQNRLGPHLKEAPYADALELLFKEQNKKFAREYEIKVPFGVGEVSGGRVDFLYENKLLIDAKAKKYITKEDYLQMLRYLEAANLKLGIIVNFRSPKVTYKRVVNSKALEK